MNLFSKFSNKIKVKNSEQSLLTSMFSVAGLSLALIFVVALIASFTIDFSGVLKKSELKSFDWNIYRDLSVEGPLRRIGILSVFSMILIIATFVMRLIWIFRFQTVSKQFIYITYTLYIISQGIGFGILFATWKTPELIAIFGITSFLFCAMALLGYFAKNLSGLFPFLIVGTIMALTLSIINWVLRIAGVYNENITFVFLMLWTFLSLGYIAFDVWWIKKTSEFYSHALIDNQNRFRFVTFFAFILLTDFIWLLWTIVRWYQRIR